MTVTSATTAEQARNRIEHCTRLLTANLLRVLRGAGDAGGLAHQVSDLAEAIDAFRKVVPVGYLNLGDALKLHEHHALPREAIDYAQGRIIDGALQIVASRLLGQHMQESAGDKEMFDGVRDLNIAREEFNSPVFRAATEDTRGAMVEKNLALAKQKQRERAQAARKGR